MVAAVNVTDVPAHTVSLGLGLMVIVGGAEPTTIVILLLTTLLAVAQE
jgi:hypothetical protein